MKIDYKFKYKGKWHDILCVPGGKFKGEAIADTCFGTPDEYHFRVLESSLPKLLAILRKLNIEVAEVCDKLRWKREYPGNPPFIISQKVLTNKGAVFYQVSGDYWWNNNTWVNAGSFESAKAACQDDFQKRRAK